MAATRGRVDKQLIKSTTPRSLVYTDLSNEQTYFAPPTGADYVLQWDNGATDFAWLPTTSLINIYNNDGTLSANRTVTGEDKFLLFSFDDAVDSTSELSLNASSISAGVHNISTDTISSFQTLSDSVIFSAEDLSSGEQAFSSYTTTSITNALYGTTGVQSFTWDGVGGMVVQDSELLQGMKYAASYAAYFATNPRSIPDVGYINSLIGGMVTGSGTATQIAYWSGSSTITGNVNLYWNNTTKAFGIGTNSPAPNSFFAGGAVLHVRDATSNLPNIRLSNTSNEFTFGIDNVRAYFFANKASSFYWNATAAAGQALRFINKNTGADVIAIDVSSANDVRIGTGGVGAGRLAVWGSGTGSSTYTAQLHNSTGTSNSFVVRDDSRIGVGTASPVTPLHVLYNDSSFGQGITLENTNTSVNALTGFMFRGSSAANSGIIFSVNSNYSASNIAASMIYASMANFRLGLIANASGGGSATDIYMSTLLSNTTYQMVIKANGYVGINKNAPTGMLDVVSTGSSTGVTAQFNNSTGSNNALVILDNRNVGFGTATPQYPIDILYSDNAFLPGLTIRNQNTGTSALSGINLRDSSNALAGAFYTTSSNYIIAAQATSMIFSSVGLVRLGFIANASNTASTPQDLYFSTLGNNTTYQLFIQGSTGNVGLSNNTPTARLHIPAAGLATAGAAPLKFTTASAALLTTPEAGAMEVLTTRIYYTDSTATRNTLAYLTDITSGVSITTDYIPVGTGTGITASTLFRDSATLLTSTDAVRTIGIYLNSMASLTDGIIANTGLTTSTSFQPFSATRAGSGNMVIRMDHAGTGNNYLYLKGNTTGDSYVQFNTGGANNYAVGTDASATHVFKIRYGADPSTGTTLFTANSSGNVGLRTDPHATQQIYLSGTLRVDLGSDATGDVYYRNSGGAFTRLAAGTNGHVLTLASGIPSWAAVSTGITSGTTKQIPYYSASNTLSSPSAAGVDALTWDFATAFFGVGTNAPASRLHVVNSNATTSYATFSGLLNTSASITSLDISRTAGSGSLDLVQTHSGTGNNCIVLQGNGTGDTFFTYGVSGPSVAYSHGVDASDSLIWKFGSGGTGSNPSTNTNLFWTANHTTNKIGLRTNPHATQDIYLLGTLRLDLGSDATGDIYYRNSGGAFTRLGIGSTDQVLKVASGIPSWSADLNGIYTGSGSLSTDTTVSMGTHFLFIEGSSATSHATFINLTPATDTIDIVARDLSIGSYIGEVYIDPTFVSIGLEHDTIPGGDASYINFQPTGSTWIWGNHEITLDGSGITVTDAVGSGFVYAADYSTSILTNNRSVPDIFTVRENNIENYTIVTSTTSPFNLSGLPPDFLINQGGTQATFTFSLPATPANGQICKLTFNNIVTTLTITAQGGITILGTAPTTAMVGTQLEYKYYSSISAWIRVK